MTPRSRWIVIAAPLLATFGATSIGFAGNLEPPGPPAPTMKPLSYVEPRIPIRASDLPLSITTAGSYYLVENINSSGAGITISASDVAIDLSGFTLSGSMTSGISATSGVSRVSIRNGNFSGWFTAINLQTVSGVTIQDVKVQSLAGFGVWLGDGANVRELTIEGQSGLACGARCIVTRSQFNVVYTGLGAGERSIISETTSTAGDAMGVGHGSLVNRCVILGYDSALVSNGSVKVVDSWLSSSGDVGIALGDRSQILNSTLEYSITEGVRVGQGSNVDGLSVIACAGSGLIVGDNSRVVNSSIESATTAIRAGSKNWIAGNTCKSESIGISVTGSGNRISDNFLNGGTVGLAVTGSGNTIQRNNAHGNSVASYQVAAGNDAAPIGPAATATSPWANIQW